MMGQPEKRARAPAGDWSNRGGAAHNPGWQHPERGQDTGRQPLGLERLGGRAAKKRQKTGLDQSKRNKIISGSIMIEDRTAPTVKKAKKRGGRAGACNHSLENPVRVEAGGSPREGRGAERRAATEGIARET